MDHTIAHLFSTLLLLLPGPITSCMNSSQVTSRSLATFSLESQCCMRINTRCTERRKVKIGKCLTTIKQHRSDFQQPGRSTKVWDPQYFHFLLQIRFMREGGIAEPKYKEATGGTNQSKWGHVELPKVRGS